MSGYCSNVRLLHEQRPATSAGRVIACGGVTHRDMRNGARNPALLSIVRAADGSAPLCYGNGCRPKDDGRNAYVIVGAEDGAAPPCYGGGRGWTAALAAASAALMIPSMESS
jgi:hypothetical protein